MKSSKQQIGLAAAVAIGLASMLGAGVFSVFGPAYLASGDSLLYSLLLAGAVAVFNSITVYQLARRTSRAGGIYSYARAEWSPNTSFIAGFSFVSGKIASIAAIAYTFGNYVAPNNSTLFAIGAIVLLTALNSLGIERTASVAAVLATVTTIYLVIVSTVGVADSQPSPISLFSVIPSVNALNVLQGASLLFFAFAGYARVATLGDEVTKPKVNIPRAIVISLSIVLTIYLLVATALARVLGDSLGNTTRPFVTMTERVLPVLPSWVSIVVVSGASLGSMLALLAGVSRTAATMSEDSELPAPVARRNRFGAPWLAEVGIAIGAILMLVFGLQLSWMVGFSSFSVLLYYAVGHATAFFSKVRPSAINRAVQIIGFALCALLVVCVPGPAIWISTIILLTALLIRAVATKRRRG